MTPPPPPARQELQRYSCSLCARRKVKCDKIHPCSNCNKAQVPCVYESHTVQRPRKRAGDEELITRLAQYEDLMRKHNVDFSHYANTWVPSSLELKQRDRSPHIQESIAYTTSQLSLKTDGLKSPTNDELYLWSNLSSELKHPPIQSVRHRFDPRRHPIPPLLFTYPSNQPELQQLHPEPRQIFRLWQIFVEKINPVTKVVHVPTLQQRILDASWDPSVASKPLTAIMFAIYNLAITGISSDDCQTFFGETKDILLRRYRAATVRALVVSEFLTTRELETLQALVLFLFTDPESELTCTLTGAAIRLGQIIGLHRENTDAKIAFFEKEMRIRLWWQLRCLDLRSRAFSTPGTKPLPPAEFGDIRLPLNLNDADLHPDMVGPPVEQTGPTEMVCVSMKFDTLNWLQSSPKAAMLYANLPPGPSKGSMPMELQIDAVDELEAILQQKYLRKLDKNIPLHSLTDAVAKFTISRMRFKLHLPRARAGVNGGGEIYISREESDILFNSALAALEMVDMSINGKLSSHLFIHMTFTYQLDAYIYVISELRRRCSGDRIALAWKLVENLYSEHPELIDDIGNTFFFAMGDLTLEAWEARRREMLARGGQDGVESENTPQFVWLLRRKRESMSEDCIQVPILPDADGLNGLMLTEDTGLDWEYWNDFLLL